MQKNGGTRLQRILFRVRTSVLDRVKVRRQNAMRRLFRFKREEDETLTGYCQRTAMLLKHSNDGGRRFLTTLFQPDRQVLLPARGPRVAPAPERILTKGKCNRETPCDLCSSPSASHGAILEGRTRRNSYLDDRTVCGSHVPTQDFLARPRPRRDGRFDKTNALLFSAPPRSSVLLPPQTVPRVS